MYIAAFLIIWFMFGLIGYSLEAGRIKRYNEEIGTNIFSTGIYIKLIVFGPFNLLYALEIWQPKDGMWL